MAKKLYRIAYRLYKADDVRYIDMMANSKENAYERAYLGAGIAKECGEYPYSAWVDGVQYKNGRYHSFDTFEGKPLSDQKGEQQ